MEIRLLDKTEYELSKELWLTCFPEDDRDFVDLYYSMRSKPEYALGAFEGTSCPIAMLHMIPMKMRFGSDDRSVCFVAGVSTHPLFRRRGVCAKLFEAAFRIMKERGFEATALKPFRASFYERFGYKTFMRREHFKVSDERLNTIGRTHDDRVLPDPSALSDIYASFMDGYSGFSVRDKSCFEYLIKEYSMDGAVLNTTARGCCAGYESNGALIVNELFFTPGTDPLSLLPAGFSEYSFPLPIGSGLALSLPHSIEEFSMIKPLAEGFDPFAFENYGFDMY